MPNRLAKESSPYLLQHKDNPVDWYPWGEEAFARARAEDKPIFLSIGYSTCHWCHVMEHESFEKESVAAALNRDFVSIKVDREERPDVDDIYMRAVQMMTGKGGWPLSLFLTPDRRPFYGGTYFPPDAALGQARLPAAARGDRDGLEESAARRLESFGGRDGRAPDTPTRGGRDAGQRGRPRIRLGGRSVGVLERQFDEAEGGFGGAPKFPPAMRLELLLRHWIRTGDASARAMTEKTLAKMAAGGMYDQVGGGFHRYSVDARWLVPHFEKMLYDNAMLARVYLLAFRAFGNPDDARIARETLDYLLREMTPEGGRLLRRPGRRLRGARRGRSTSGTRRRSRRPSGRTPPRSSRRASASRRAATSRTARPFSRSSVVLRSSRAISAGPKRTSRPSSPRRAGRCTRSAGRVALAGTDDKLLTDWTALAISAFALAARLLDEPRYERAARAAADRILRACVRGNELLHRERAGHAGIPGFASDYANLIEALLDLYEATFEPRYFAEAVRLEKIFDERFPDPRGGYFLSAADHDGLIVRPKETYDGATPSSNSVAAMNLLRLFAFTGDDAYRRRADAVFSAPSPGSCARAATAFPRLLCALDWRESAGRGRSCSPASRAGRTSRRCAARSSRARVLNRVVAHADSAAGVPELAGLAEGRAARDGAAAAYVCEGFACQGPRVPTRRRFARSSTHDHRPRLRRAVPGAPRALRPPGAPGTARGHLAHLRGRGARRALPPRSGAREPRARSWRASTRSRTFERSRRPPTISGSSIPTRTPAATRRWPRAWRPEA